MSDPGDAELRAKLRKIEALFAGAGTEGERLAAGAALQRIRERLERAQRSDRIIETKFTFPDAWSRRLFVALCRRYDLRPYRYKRQRYTTVMLRAPDSFVRQTLWPEFGQLNEALRDWLAAATDRIIREEVYRDVHEADEVEEPSRLK